MGIKIKRSGSDFESEIKKGFIYYEEHGHALLQMMPVATAPMKGNPRLRILAKKAPFDVYGYSLDGNCTFIAAELKQSHEKNRLPIVAPDKKGDGIQFHQLEALYQVASAGGMAFIVWRNGGQVGVITNERIIEVYMNYTIGMSKRNESYEKSIQWEVFNEVPMMVVGTNVSWNWLSKR